MAGLISWLGKEAKNAENAIGGAVHGAENYAGHAAQQLPQVAQSVARQAPQMISRVAPPQVQPAFNLANFLAQHSGQVANTRLPGGIISPSGKPGPTIGGAISSLPKMAWNMTPILPGVVSDVSQGGPSAIIPSTLINTGQFGQGLVSGVERAGLGLAGDVRDSVSGPNIYTNGHSNSPMTISDIANTPGVLGLGAKGLRAVNNVLGTDPGATPSLSQQIKEQGVVPALANATFEVAGPLGVAKGIKEAPKTVANVSKATVKTAQKVASDPVLNNEGGYLRLPDATGKQKGPQVSYKDGIKGSEVSDKPMKVKPEGVAALQQGKAVPIQNLIDHKAQAKDYPTLYGEKGGVKAVLNNQIDSAYKFDPATRTIHLNPDVLGNTAERVKTSLHGDQGKRLLVQGMSKAIDDYAGVHTPLPIETQLGMAMKNGVQPTPAEVGMAHSKLPGELRASSQAERMNMSQRELGKNPIGQPRTPSPLDKVKQLATTGLFDERGTVPIDPSQHPINGGRKYQTIHSTGEVKTVKGEPIKIADGIDTFIHRDENGNWAVSEATTGRSVTGGGYSDRSQAIQAAKSRLNEAGVEKVKALVIELGGVKPKVPTTAPNLHLDEPTPAANANLDDVKSVGNALGKTKAYIKRVEAAHKATFGQDGKAWKDYNARYDKGVDGYNAPNKAVWDSYMAGDPKLFPKTRDGMMLQDVITGDKAVAHPDNPAYNKLYEQKAREAGLAVTHFGNGDVLVGKSPEAVEAYKALASKGKVHTNDPATKQLEYSLLGYRPERFSNKLSQHLEALKNDQKALQERYGELKPKGSAATVDPAKVAEFKKSLEAPKSSAGGGENAADVALGKTLPKKLSQSERQKLIDESPQQQTKNQVSMAVDEGNLKGAIAKATGVSQEADDRILEGQRAGEGLGKHDLNLLYRVENGEKIENVAKDAKNSKQFTKVATKLADAFDYTLAALRAAGSKTLRQNNYIIPHYYEASKELMDKLGIPEDSRVTVGPKSGFHDQHAKYSSYLEAGKHGLKPLFDNPMDAVDQYRKGATNFIRNNGLYEALKTAAPNDVAELGNVKDIGTGKTFTQAAGRLPFNATEEVNNAIQNFKSTKIANPYLRAGYSALKKVTSLEKATLFFGAPFHYVNITKNFLGLTMTTGHEVIAAKGIGKALNSALVPGGYRRMVEAARADGTLQYARESLGLKLNEDNKPYRPSTVKGNIQGALDNINPYGLTHRNMNHFIDAYGLELARAARKYGVKEGSADAVELGHEYNMILGRINAAVQGHNPFISKIISQGALAPQFARSQLGAVKDAAVKSIPVKGQAKHIAGIYNAGDVARSTVAGTRILEAAIAITASAAISGQAPTLAKIMNQAGLNPNNPNPNIDLQHNNKSGHNQVMNLPTDPLGLAFGAVSDPAHFGNARLSPALSAIERFATNQDWNGNQLADPNSPSYLKDKAIKSLSGGLPIGLQNYQGAKSGKLTTGQAVAQEFGGRVKTDPNDPNIQALNFKDKTVNSLPANIRDKAKQVFGVNQTGPDGKPLTVVPALHTQDNALTMIQHPELIDVGKKMNDKNAALGLPSDPFYGLSRDQQMTVLNIQADKFRDPAQKKALSDAGNAWLPQYYDDRSAFFDALNLPASTKTQELAGPKLSDHVKGLFKIADPKARAQALATDPEAQAYFNANDNYINQGRAKQGLPSMKSYPTSTPYIEAQLNAKNFKDPQVQQYLNQVAAYNVEKGGAEAQYQGTNLSQSALKGVKNLGNYGIVQNPDGTLAIAGSNADAPGSQLARYGSGGKKGRKGRATKMAKMPKIKALAVTKLPHFKAPKYTAHASKLPKIAKAKLPVTRKLA